MRILQYTLIALIAPTTMLSAQTVQHPDSTLSRSVVVEQTYMPEIGDARKVNVLPPIRELNTKPRQVEYASEMHPVKTMPASADEAYIAKESPVYPSSGFLRVGYGNYGNMDVLGNYFFRFSPRDKLDLNASFGGMNGTMDSWKHHHYRTRAGLDYEHGFSALSLRVKGNFGMDNFNFRPTDIVPREDFMMGDMQVDVRSTDKDAAKQYNIGASAWMFDRRNRYLDGMIPTDSAGVREMQYRLHADVRAEMGDMQYVGVKAEGEYRSFDADGYDANTMIGLNAYYLYHADAFNVRAGAYVVFNFGHGKLFQAAPDLTADFAFSDKFVVFGQATGGPIRNDFRRLAEWNPYAAPMLGSKNRVKDSFDQLNARIGFRGSFVDGFWISLDAGYQRLNDALRDELKALDPTLFPNSTNGEYVLFAQENIANTNFGAAMSYDYKDIASFAIHGRYYTWDALSTYENMPPDYNPIGYSRPQITVDARLDFRPVNLWRVGVGYEYVRRQQNAMRDINDLSATVDFALMPNIHIYARFANLLNAKNEYYFGGSNPYPAQGFNFVGGLAFVF